MSAPRHGELSDSQHSQQAPGEIVVPEPGSGTWTGPNNEYQTAATSPYGSVNIAYGYSPSRVPSRTTCRVCTRKLIPNGGAREFCGRSCKKNRKKGRRR